MATKIVTKNSSTASAVPTSSDLVQGELAVNVADKRLFTEDNAGAIVELGTNPSGNVTFQDNGKAIFGAGSDLQIYHDGSNSYLKDAGTGDLYIQGEANVRITDGDGNKMFLGQNDGEVQLYYNGYEKLNTTSTGIDVTGTVTADGLTLDGAATITVTDNSDTLTLVSTDADANVGPVLSLHRDSASPADNDVIGRIVFKGDDSVGNAATYARIETTALDVTNGSEDGRLDFYTAKDDAFTAAMSITSNNVGIGTSSPNSYAGQTTLNINSAGVARLDLDINNTMQGFLLAESGYTGLYTPSGSNSLRFGTNNTERMRIDSSGNVGIGTVPQASQYSYIKNVQIQGLQAYGHTTINDYGGFFTNAYTNSAGAKKYISSNQYAHNLHFDNSGSLIYYNAPNTGSAGDTISFAERMRIDSSGRVGIGVTPSSGIQLEVGNSTNSSAVSRVTNGTVSVDLTASSSGKVFLEVGTNHPLIFATNATERMRIDASGNLLVGKTSTSYAVEGIALRADNAGVQSTVTDEAPFTANRLNSDGRLFLFAKDTTTVGGIGTQGGDLYLGTDDANIKFFNSASIQPVNSVGGVRDNAIDLGASSARFKDLHLSGTAHTGLNIHLKDSGTTRGKIELNASDTDDLDIKAVSLGSNMKFFTVDTERMRIDSSGNLLVGSSSFSFAGSNDCVQISGAEGRINIENDTTSTAYALAFYNTNGLVGKISTSGSSTNYDTSSDQRLKENIVDAPSASDDIDAVQVRSFDWKADGSHQKYGMIAQELQTVAPEAVSGDADSEEMMGVDYSKLVPMLIKEIQSLRNRVAQLEE